MSAPRADLVRVQDTLSPRGGLVRGTRRPPGWTAPGPAPHPPEECGSLWPDGEEDLCWLAGDWRLLQRTDGHRFSLDDLVTAHHAIRCAGAEPPNRILDLGCGIGTVLLLMAWRFPAATVRGVEAQTVSAGLARRSIAWNGVQDRCAVISGDLRDGDVLKSEPVAFDLITGTPPYFARGTGIESEQIQQGPCRFEHRGGIEDYAAAAARHLAPGAAFVGCAAATQTARVRAAAAAAGLFIERQRDVIPRAGKNPLVLLFCMRARAPIVGAAGQPRRPDLTTLIEPPLVVRDRDGRRTDEFVALRTAMGMPP